MDFPYYIFIPWPKALSLKSARRFMSIWPDVIRLSIFRGHDFPQELVTNSNHRMASKWIDISGGTFLLFFNMIFFSLPKAINGTYVIVPWLQVAAVHHTGLYVQTVRRNPEVTRVSVSANPESWDKTATFARTDQLSQRRDARNVRKRLIETP